MLILIILVLPIIIKSIILISIIIIIIIIIVEKRRLLGITSERLVWGKLLCVLIPALNLSKNSCALPCLDKALGKRTLPKITRNGQNNPQWRLTATNRRLIVTNRRLIATNRPKSATNRD